MSKWVDTHKIMIEKDMWYVTADDAEKLLDAVNIEVEGLRDMICARDCYIEQVRPKNRKRTLPLIVLREWINDLIKEEISISRLRQNIDEFFKVNRT